MILAPSSPGFHAMRAALRRVVVAVPVRNEARRLPRLLDALAVAAGRSPLPVTAVIFANNCSDASEGIARAFRHPNLAVEVMAQSLGDPTAGLARRLACDLAARQGALVMTTDADAVPHPGWIAAALAAAEMGADVICGRVEADLRRAQASPRSRRVAALDTAYRGLLHDTRHAIEHLGGLVRSRPHYIESGASLAIRADCYHMIRGMPEVRSSEDRALVHRAERHGLRVAYDPGMCVTVSARLTGRAEGGMAETLRRRMTEEDPLVDQALLPLPVIRQLWQAAMAGRMLPYPSRARAGGWQQLRASDVAAALPALAGFVDSEVRPVLLRAVAA